MARGSEPTSADLIFCFSVDPGEHQVCTNWQSGTFKETSKRIGSAMTLKTEAGKVYYFRTPVFERSERDLNVKFEPVEAPESQFLISPSAFSTSPPHRVPEPIFSFFSSPLATHKRHRY